MPIVYDPAEDTYDGSPFVNEDDVLRLYPADVAAVASRSTHTQLSPDD